MPREHHISLNDPVQEPTQTCVARLKVFRAFPQSTSPQAYEEQLWILVCLREPGELDHREERLMRRDTMRVGEDRFVLAQDHSIDDVKTATVTALRAGGDLIDLGHV